MKKQIQKISAFFFILTGLYIGSSFASAAAPLSAQGQDTIAGYAVSLKSSRGTPEEDVTFRVEKPNKGIVNIPAKTNEVGIAAADLFSLQTTEAGTYSVSVYYRDYASEHPSISTFEVFPGEVSASQSTVTPSMGAIAADGREETFIEVTLRDKYSNPIPDHLLTLVSSRREDHISEDLSGIGTDRNGKKIFHLFSEEPGISYITVLDRATGTPLDARAKVIFFEAEAEKSDLPRGGSKLTANIFGENDSSELSGPIVGFELTFEDGKGNTNSAVVGSDQNYFTVRAIDAEKKTVKNYTGTVQIGTSDPSANFPHEHTFEEKDLGVFQFSLAFRFSQTGKQTLQVFDYDPDTEKVSRNISGEIEIMVKESEGNVPSPNTPPGGEVDVKTPEEGSTYATRDISLTGKGNARSDLLVFLDDKEVSSVSTDADGVFFDTIRDVQDGAHTIYLQEKAGKKSLSKTVSFSVDTRSPTLDDFRVSPKGEVEAGTKIMVTLLSEAAIPKTHLRVDNQEISFTEKEGTPGNYEVTFDAPKIPGEYSLDVILIDPYENESSFVSAAKIKVIAKKNELPAFPRNVKAAAVEEGVKIEWDLIAKSETEITMYIIFGGKSESSLEEMKTVPGTQHEVLLQNLEQGTQYFFAVSALDANKKQSVKSEIVSARSLFDAKEFSAPKNVTAVLSGESVNISWDLIEDHPEGIVLYSIYMGTSAVNLAVTESVSGTKTQTLISDLRAGMSYAFAVRAIDTKGKESAMSSPFFLQIPGNSLSENSVLAEAGNTFAKISWDPSPEADSYIVAYGIRPGGKHTEETVVSKTKNSVEIKDLMNGVVYYFTVIPQKNGFSTGEAYEETWVIPSKNGLHGAANSYNGRSQTSSGPGGVFVFVGMAFLLSSFFVLMRKVRCAY
ncbi:fibronectin type III domain-containing protein [Candidatus Peregrinibacteria bacterium]|nr:fibronectin type III domain-containing protein [Candidatus Peregrinibacteria bacterium]